MSIERNLNGSITISDIIDGYLVKRVYFDYTIKECKEMFKNEFKSK
jgi:hypothetical protein